MSKSALVKEFNDEIINPLLNYKLKLTMNTNTSCALNCSNHGDCYDGVCFCEVEYSGSACKEHNIGYYVALSVIFYAICATSLLQLVLCIKSEFVRQKPRSILRSFKVTTQKALYFFIFVATAIRGMYFSYPLDPTLRWANSLMSAYYPLVLSGCSLLVCFWAEVFHLYDVNVQRPSFLSKSFTGFILFNVVTYSLLLSELFLIQFAALKEVDKNFFTRVFNSIYAILMLIVVIFFLIYGIEVYFKMRGAFIQGSKSPANISQLKQSRLGLVSQALMLLFTVLFIFSEVLGHLWKEKVPVPSRNLHQIMFRLVEIGIALWYPCVLWNCICPEKLWILNPRRILKKESFKSDKLKECEAPCLSPSSSTSSSDCWICYDSERSDAGPLISPCSCKGDVGTVHHECLRTWLMESAVNPDNLKCKVCRENYVVSEGDVWLPSGYTTVHWFQAGAVMSVMSVTIAGAALIINICTHMSVRTITVGVTILIEYVCLRLLGVNLLSAYQRAKFSAVKIITRENGTKESFCHMVTVNETKSVEAFNDLKTVDTTSKVKDIGECI